MDRVAVFVDAGYLFAQGSALIAGSKQPRERVQLQIGILLDALRNFAAEHSGLKLLRIYWNDGMRGQPSPDQTAIAAADDVKLRLGQVNSVGQQKGVDALIVTDLIELARNRAIADAILLSGDEDLRIGVQLAQSFGVRVHLLGIAPMRGSQSPSLIREADTAREWGPEMVATFLTTLPDQGQSGRSPIHAAVDPAITALVDGLSAEQRLQLLQSFKLGSTIPNEIDRQILGIGRRILTTNDLDQATKRQLREMFKTALARLPEPGPGGTA